MIYSILDYGAKPDGVTLNTAAIQRAIDECHAAGGGTVQVPKGEFLCSSLEMKSNVRLTLDMGAVLRVSPNKADYIMRKECSRGILIYANGAENFVIDGQGMMLGNGQELWGVWWGKPVPNEFRTRFITIYNCKNVRIENITLKESDSWNMHLVACENVHITGVRLLSNIYHLNSDGIDPDSCKNVFISDCLIVTGDDCICPKASVPGKPMENLVVSNCILQTTTTAIKIGTDSVSPFRDLHFNNCTIRNSCIGLGIYMKDGSVAERISFTNISLECPSDWEKKKPVIPMYIDVEKRYPHQESCGKVRDILFQNLQITSSSGSLLQGMPESHLENITLKDITIRATQAPDFSVRRKQIGGYREIEFEERDIAFIRQPAYLSTAYIDGLTAENIVIYQEDEAKRLEMQPLFTHEVSDLEMNRVRIKK